MEYVLFPGLYALQNVFRINMRIIETQLIEELFDLHFFSRNDFGYDFFGGGQELINYFLLFSHRKFNCMKSSRKYSHVEEDNKPDPNRTGSTRSRARIPQKFILPLVYPNSDIQVLTQVKSIYKNKTVVIYIVYYKLSSTICCVILRRRFEHRHL